MSCRTPRVVPPLAALSGLLLGLGLLSAALPADDHRPERAPIAASPPTPMAVEVPDATLEPATRNEAGDPAQRPAPETAAPAHGASASPPASMPWEEPPPATQPAREPSAPALPPVAAPAAPAPAPSGTPTPAPAAGPTDTPETRVLRAFTTAVPASWRAAIIPRFEIIGGSTSWAHTTGTIQIARSHTDFPADVLADLVAHEFGHLIAFRYGTQAYAGAAPEGWPAPQHRPEEAWADCVQRAFTGRATSSHGLAPCSGPALQWATDWLARGPAAHARTR